MRTEWRRMSAVALSGALLVSGELFGQSEGLLAHWPFERSSQASARDVAAGVDDAIEGRAAYVAGVEGAALCFDGFTTAIIRGAARAPKPRGDLSIEAWVALAAYPWNWCPLLSQRDGEKAGYALLVGPRGQLRLEVATADGMRRCTSADFLVPLRAWVHLAGVYKGGTGLRLYVNGEAAGRSSASAAPRFAPEVDLRIGINHAKVKPSNIHRPHGTLATWWTLDGLLDELKLWDRALSPEQVRAAFARHAPAPAAPLALRRLPSGPEGPGPFGAFYCKLAYDPGWDALWRVGPDPDVLVRFDRSPARVVFWRGTRYSPAWVTGNGLWMADQSVEAWETGENDREGCFEHMQDRLCRYAHVRIIESHAARVVVHWRYAPVSSHNHLWNVDEKTGRACWVDEYYTIYPDAAGIRKVCWSKGTLGKVRQFQESLPFTQPGQWSDEVVEREFCTVANLAGESATLAFVEKPQRPKPGLPADLCMQMYNFKAPSNPFIIFEQGDRMHYVRDLDLRGYHRPGACNHWPVGQAACDGRTSQAPDRPTHFLGFPISYPPVHESDGRCWWNGLYGMSERPLVELVPLARSWNHPPPIEIDGAGCTSKGYDRGQRAWVLACEGAGPPAALGIDIGASAESPLWNPAFVIAGWGEAGATITLDGRRLERGPSVRVGHRRRLEGVDLVVWLDLQREVPVSLKIARGSGGGGRGRR